MALLLRYDYEGVEKTGAEAVMEHQIKSFAAVTGTTIDGSVVALFSISSGPS